MIELDTLLNSAREGFAKVNTRPEWENLKAGLLGPKGSVTAATKALADVPKEEKPVVGKKLNEVKKAIEALSDEAFARIEATAALSTLGPAIDPTLPVSWPLEGSVHPISSMMNRMVDIFTRAGFVVRQHTEIETEWFCFDALGSPADHPSRDMQDTYYMPTSTQYLGIPAHNPASDEKYLLRTHTSTSQIRTMLKEQPPLRVIVPGRVFRRDNADATHSANFHQMEGFVLDTKVSLKDMKAMLDYFIRSLFGPNAQTRLRPSYFPFVEPGFELDFRTPNLGKLSNKWIELWGCGMIHPKVLESVGYNPEFVSGYAFGMGVERLAMILHGLDDIRHCYQNDLRLLKQLR